MSAVLAILILVGFVVGLRLIVRGIAKATDVGVDAAARKIKQAREDKEWRDHHNFQ